MQTNLKCNEQIIVLTMKLIEYNLFYMRKQEWFFIFLIILTIFTLSISIYGIIYLTKEIIKHSSNIIAWLEEQVRGPKNTIISRFVDLSFLIFTGLIINIFLIKYCIDEYKKL